MRLTANTPTPNSTSTSAITSSGRYASLHRAIETRGIDEKGWAEMLRVCLRLDKGEEALHAYRNLTSYGVRVRAHALLVECGILDAEEEKPEREESCVTEAQLEPTFLEKLGESFGYLLEGKLMIPAAGGTAAFGALLLLGGLLSRSVEELRVDVLVLPIGIVLLAWVWMTAARITRATARGFDDAPDLPTIGEIIVELPRTVSDLFLTASVCLGPAILMCLFTDHAALRIPLLLVGCATISTVHAIRQVHPTWSPTRISTSILNLRSPLLLATGGCALWFLPVAVAMHQTASQAPHLLAAYAGLLSVIPTLLSARLLGQSIRFFDAPRT